MCKNSAAIQTDIVSRLWFYRRPWRPKTTSGGILCIFWSHTFETISWMSKKQTSVSHSSTETEIISLDADLRMDGIPAFTLWHLMIDVFHSVPCKTDGSKRESWGKPSAVLKSNITPSQSSTSTSFQQILITFHQIQRIFLLKYYVVCLWEQWESNQND